MAQALKKPVFAIVGQATNEPDVRELFNGVATLDDTSTDHRDAARLLEIRAGELARRLR
jgi:hypothetical protein